MSNETIPGRRERKKAATRQAIADAAFELFTTHGYDQVSVKQVADRADVATTTLFKHFPRKEALVFDLEDDVRAGLVAVVTDRPEGRSVIDALRDHVLHRCVTLEADPRFAQMRALIASSAELHEYSERMWARQAAALGAAVAEATGKPADDLASAALARFVLDVPALVADRADPKAAVEEVFDLLTGGWGRS